MHDPSPRRCLEGVASGMPEASLRPARAPPPLGRTHPPGNLAQGADEWIGHGHDEPDRNGTRNFRIGVTRKHPQQLNPM
jgi:hypothetical protein